MLSKETQFRSRETYRLKMSGWKMLFHANGNQKKAEVAVLISEKIDVKIKTVTRDKEGHNKMINPGEDLTIVIYIHPTSEHLNT